MPRIDDDDDRPRRARRRRDEEDDDRDERPDRRSGGGGTSIALIIGGVILGIFVICGGVSLYIYTSVRRGVQDIQGKAIEEMEKARLVEERLRKEQEEKEAKQKEREKDSPYGMAKAAANSIMQSVKGKRVEALHEGATAAFQKRTTVEQLRTLIETNAGYLDTFRAFENEWGVEPVLTGTTFTFSNQLQTAFGFRTVKVTMVLEKGEWKLDQFLVENKF